MLNIAILGAGKIANSMSAALKGLEEDGKSVHRYAVAARDADRARAFADRWGFETSYGSYEEMLQDPKVDLVYIATPHSHHAEHAKLCIAHGKHVLCEKAFTANAKMAEELFSLAAEKQVLITEAIWTRYMPSRQIIDDLVAEGVIGEVTSLAANLNYKIDDKDRIRLPELCGGALLDIGIYTLNFASMVMGDDILSTTAVCTKNELGMDMQDNIILTYKNGKTAALHSNAQAGGDRRGLLFGTKGYMEVMNINNPEWIKIYDLNHQEIRHVDVPEQINGYEYEVLSCMKAIEEGALECPEMPHEETLVMLRQMDAIRADWGIVYPFE